MVLTSPPAVMIIVLAFLIFYRALRTSLYEIKTVRINKKIRTTTDQPKSPPLISVIVLSENNEHDIENCLNSIYKSSVKKFEVIVVDNHSSDSTKTVIQNYIKSHPKRAIRLVAKRKYSAEIDLKNLRSKKYASGDILFVIRASHAISKKTLQEIRKVFVCIPDIDTILPSIRYPLYPNIGALLCAFGELSKRKNLKIGSGSGAPGNLYSEEVYAVRSDCLNKRLNRRRRYIENIRISTTVSNNFLAVSLSAMKNTNANFSLVLIGLISSALIVLYLISGSGIFFLFGWVALSLEYIFTIISDKTTPNLDKIRLLFYVPILYIYTFCSTILWVIDEITHIILHMKSLARLSTTFSRLKVWGTAN